MQSGGDARYNPVTLQLTAECDCPGPKRNQALRRCLGVNLFQVVPDLVFTTADTEYIQFHRLPVAYYISGRGQLPSRFGRTLNV
jgi:hypothetical protein